ncbi:MAG: permease prefix domain 1-containing protein [Treponema sp.]|nr:permease prefix domain 1-containing protein [Treponema sp.]
MNTRVHYFVRGLFRSMEKTAEVAEQQQELESHILEHLADLSAGGMDGEEAFAKAVDSLGDLDELIETLSGRKIKIPIWRHDLKVYSVELLYGMAHICGMILGFNHWGLQIVSLYVGVGGFLAYSIPFFNVLVHFVKYPDAVRTVPAVPSAEVRNSFLGWFFISLIAWIMNICMIRVYGQNAVWAWMPTMGLFTWPLMRSVDAWLLRRGK